MDPLRRALGLAGLTMYGVGVIVGAGIYSVIGAAAGEAGEALWLSFLLAAAPAALAALSYAEMSAMLPRAGAEFLYLRHALPRWPGVSFITGFVVALAAAASTATVSIAFAGYLRFFVDAPEPILALGLIAACTGLNIAGIRQSTWVNVTLTLIEVSGLVLVIAAGARAPDFGRALAAPVHPGVLRGAAVVFFVYTGFESIVNLADEARRPDRDIPRAIVLSLGISSVLYLLVALAVTALVSPAELAASEAPLARAALAVSPRLAAALGWIALCSTANTALICLITASRLLYGMSGEGAMPGILGRTLPGPRTPWVAALAVAGVAVALLPLGEVEVVASVSSLSSLLAFGAVSVALIVLRWREPERPRPIRVRPSIGRVPALPVLHVVLILALLTRFPGRVFIAGAVALALGLLAYRIMRARQEGRAGAGRREG